MSEEIITAFEYIAFHPSDLPYGRGGNLATMFPELASKRADAVGRYLVDNGSTTTVSTERFLKDGKFFGSPMRGYEMPFERAIDIDEREDLELSLFYAKKLLRQKPRNPRKSAINRAKKKKKANRAR